MSRESKLAKLYARAGRLDGARQRSALVSVCRDILKLDPRSVQALQFLSIWCLDRGEHREALGYLRACAEIAPHDEGWVLPTVVALEALGEFDEALALARRVGVKDEDYFFPYLYIGSVLESAGDTEAAARAYSIGRELNPRLASMVADASLPEAGRQRVARANVLLGRVGRELVVTAAQAAAKMFSGSDLSRIERSAWLQLEGAPEVWNHANQRPAWLLVPDLEPTPWYECEVFDWAAGLEARYDDIVHELTQNYPRDEDTAPYMKAGAFDNREWGGLVGSLDWAACHFYDAATRNEATCDRFPVTAGILDSLPMFEMQGQPVEALFSVLKPKTQIPPHYGTFNAKLTVHLPLIVPDGCYLTVNGEERRVEAGKLMAFDDTFEHEARNDSNEVRIVLLFSVWHPDLRPEERYAVEHSFAAYKQWMASRSVKAALGQEA